MERGGGTEGALGGRRGTGKMVVLYTDLREKKEKRGERVHCR